MLEPDEEVEAGLRRSTERINVARGIPQRKLRRHIDVEAGACLRGGRLRTLRPLTHGSNRNLADTVEGTIPNRPYGLISRLFVVCAGAALAASKSDEKDAEADEGTTQPLSA